MELQDWAWHEDGGLPSLLCSDNGPENVNHLVDGWLEDPAVIHLKNLPYTPQHNARSEWGMAKLKGGGGDRAGGGLRQPGCGCGAAPPGLAAGGPGDPAEGLGLTRPGGGFRRDGRLLHSRQPCRLQSNRMLSLRTGGAGREHGA